MIEGQQDPRSFVGIFSRGRNDYVGSFSPPGAGRPREFNPDINAALQRKISAPTMSQFGAALKRRLDGGSSLSRTS